MYWIQQYVIKVVSDLQQVGVFLQVVRPVPTTIKTDHPNVTDIVESGI